MGDLKETFKEELKNAKHLVILTGAGVSAESGIPTFRGEGGLWRNNNAQELATPQAFKRDPSLVWQFYQYRRNVVLEKQPNNGHRAIVEIERIFLKESKKFCLITQNVDGLHLQAGSQNVIQMHGNILETRCTKCLNVEKNTQVLVDTTENLKIPIDQLPKCQKNDCKGLLRPNVVWFNEPINPKIYEKIMEELSACDFFIIIGTSGIVYPAASFGNIVSERNVPIAEFNIDDRPTCTETKYYVQGKSGEKLPEYLLN